jgi:hypothetical protein
MDTKTSPRTKATTKVITVDIGHEQIAWLDRKASELMLRRSAYLRVLLQQLMTRESEAV